MAGMPDPHFNLRQPAHDDLDLALAEYLKLGEEEPGLHPECFARSLRAPLADQFLAEIQALGELECIAATSANPHLPRFPDLRIVRTIGSGSSGTVYEAEQVSLRRRVAIKSLHPEVAGDRDTLRRFQGEARTAASLVHPGIVPVHGFHRHQGRAYLIMGLLGGPLAP